MDNPPTIDTALIPGIRQIWNTTAVITSFATPVFASPLFPARSVIRTLYFAVNATLDEAARVTLELAFINTITPVPTDFLGTGRILPDIGPVGTAPTYVAEPQNSASHLPVNLQLPDREGRLIGRITNGTLFTVISALRLIVDGLGRLGAKDAGR